MIKKIILFTVILFPLCQFSYAEEKTVKQLQAELSLQSGKSRIAILQVLAKKHHRQNAKLELDYNNQALELLKQYPDGDLELFFRYYRGWAYLGLPDYENAMLDSNFIINKTQDQIASIHQYNGVALRALVHTYQSNHEESRKYRYKALVIAEKLNDVNVLDKATKNIGDVYYGKRVDDKTLETYLSVLRLRESSGNISSTASILRIIGDAFYANKNFDGSQKYIEKSVEVATEFNLQNELNLSRLSLAYATMRHLEKLEQIEFSVQKSHKYFEENEQEKNMREALYTLSDIYYSMGDREKAIKYRLQYLHLTEDALEPVRVAQTWRTLATLYIETSKFQNALTFAIKDLSWQVDMKKNISALTYKNLAEAYVGIGNYEKALEYYPKLVDGTLKMYKSILKSKTEQLVVQFDTEKKQQTIVLLEKETQLQNANLKQQELEVDNQKTQRNIWILGLGLPLLVLIFLFYLQTQKKKLAAQSALMNAELLERKNKLFAHVSHEFRTPLTLVLGPLSQLLKRSKNAETKHALSLASINAKRLLRMVDQLLDLARLDSGKQENTQTIDFSYVVKRTYDSLFSLFDSKQLKASLDLEDNLAVQLSTDAAEKILVNLLSNAAKYTPEQGEINVSCSQRAQSIELLIKDSGIGIAFEQQEKVFERFVRVHDENETQVPGAGIGLALVKELVESCGGSIELNSEPGQGSAFIVTLPLAKLADIESQLSFDEQIIEQEKEILMPSPISENEELEPVDEVATDKPQVLIIEDHPDMQQFIAESLKADYHCLFANDGEQGIKLAIEQVPDLIVTDLMMPKKDGFEVARVLRDDLKTSHIPIVMLTAKGDDESRLEAWKTDIDEYMAKPFNQDELLLRAKNLLNIRYLMGQRLTKEIPQTAKSNTVESENTRLAGLSDKDKLFLNRLESLVAKQYQDTSLNATSACSELALSERQFHRKMKALLSQTFSDYLRSNRLKVGAKMLGDGLQVTQVALDCGFSSQSYFSQCFKAQYGLSPSQYQES